MESAGNEAFDDETEKKGLGTPATRAGIIEKLVKGGFAERKGKSLIPTKDGLNLVCVLPEQITSPAMTAEWENTLMQIERGNADADTFLSGIAAMTSELIKAYPFLSDAETSRFDTARETVWEMPSAVVRRSMLARVISIAPIVSVPSACGKIINSFPARKRS